VSDAVFQRWPNAAAPRHRSLWLEQALAAEPEAERSVQHLEGEHRADVCIVGGGYSGLWTAIRLKELDPALNIALVEADICGAGASGRNGGIANGWLWRINTLVGLCGADDAVALTRASMSAIDDVERFCRAEGIDAQFRRAGWYWTATNRAQIGAWSQALETADGLGLGGLHAVEPSDLVRRLGSAAHLAGIVDRHAAILQPALLARGLRRVASKRGVRIYEKSPVVRVDGGSRPRVRTASGTVAAERIVLAANAWMVHLPAFRRRIVQLSSDIIATEPIPARLNELGWAGNESWSDTRINLNYARPTADRRIAFGRGGGTIAFGGRLGPRFDHSPAKTRLVRHAFRRVFPALDDVTITHAWSGPVDRAVSGFPWFDALGRNGRVFYAIGYSGTGIAACAMGGRILASLVLERDDEWTSLGAVLRRIQSPPSLPPEPARYIAGRIVQLGVARKEHAEDRGRRPSRVAETLAGLVPAPLAVRGAPATRSTRAK